MNGIIKRGSLRFLSFSAACLIAVSSVTGSAGNFLTVNAVSQTDEYRTWKQSDPRWGDLHLGKSGYNMRGSGCAATALAFLVAKAGNFTGTDFDPGVFCRLMTQFNGFGSEGDIYWAKVSSVAPGFRFEKTEYLKKDMPYEERYEAIKKYIDAGKYVIIDVQNSGHWVAVDCIENDRIISFDSGGNRNTDVFKQYDHRGNTCIKVFRSDYTTQTLPELEYNFYTGTYVVTADNLNVRKTPSSQSEREGVLVKGTKVDVRGISGCWGMIIYNDVPAWICLEYAELYTGNDDKENPVPVLTGSEVSVITGTLPSAPAVSEVPATVTTAEITSETTTVTSETTTEVTTSAPVTTTVTTSETTEATTSASVTTTVTTSETIEATTSEAVTTTTVPLTTAVTETFASESIVFEKTKCRTTAALNFRKGPGTDNGIICVIPNGTLVEIEGVNEDDRWGTIEYKGQKGWICLDYVAPEDDVTVPEETKVTEETTLPETTESESTEPEITEPEETTVPAETAPPVTDVPEPASDTMPSGEILGSAVYNLTVIKPEPDEFGILRGDVDKNGFINVLDYIMLKGHFEGKGGNELSDEADVNSDGSITLNDLMVLRGVFRHGK